MAATLAEDKGISEEFELRGPAERELGEEGQQKRLRSEHTRSPEIRSRGKKVVARFLENGNVGSKQWFKEYRKAQAYLGARIACRIGAGGVECGCCQG